jgi:hypothetical protein
MPQLLICGEQTKRTENRLRWPASFRNDGRDQIGMVAGIKSESLAGLNRNSQRSAHSIVRRDTLLRAKSAGRRSPDFYFSALKQFGGHPVIEVAASLPQLSDPVALAKAVVRDAPEFAGVNSWLDRRRRSWGGAIGHPFQV